MLVSDRFFREFKKHCACLEGKSPITYRFNDLKHLLEMAGFTVENPRGGSHWQARSDELDHPDYIHGTITIPAKGAKRDRTVKGIYLRNACKALQHMIETGVLIHEDQQRTS